MNNCAAGLSVRPCNVTMPTGRDLMGNFTGKTLIVWRAGAKTSTDRGIMASNGPSLSNSKYIESEEETITGSGGDKPASRNVCLINPPAVSAGGMIHG